MDLTTKQQEYVAVNASQSTIREAMMLIPRNTPGRPRLAAANARLTKLLLKLEDYKRRETRKKLNQIGMAKLLVARRQLEAMTNAVVDAESWEILKEVIEAIDETTKKEKWLKTRNY